MERNLKPMLCTDNYEAFVKNLILHPKYPNTHMIAIEPKLDGVRVQAYCDGKSCWYTARSGKSLDLSFLDKDIMTFYMYTVADAHNDNNIVMFDGELVSTEERTFRGVMKQLRRQKNRDTTMLRFMVFDIMEDYIEKKAMDYIGRKYYLRSLYQSGANEEMQQVFLMKFFDTTVLTGEVESCVTRCAKELSESMLKGAEGYVLKDGMSLYQPGKRSNSWCKVKERHTMDLPVVGYIPGTGKYTGTMGSLVCVLAGDTPENDKFIQVGSGFTDEERDYFKHSLDKDMVIEVGYKEITPEGYLREPIFLNLREDLIHESQ